MEPAFPTVNESLQEPQDGSLTMLDPLARRTRRRTLVLGVVAALSLSGCAALQDDGARSAADDLARGLHSEDVSGLAFSNGPGEEVQTELERILRTTGGIEPDVTVTGTEVEGTPHGRSCHGAGTFPPLTRTGPTARTWTSPAPTAGGGPRGSRRSWSPG